MNRVHAYHVLRQWEQKGRYVFTRQDLSKLFSKDKAKAFTEGLNRLVKDGLLVRACRGVFVNPHAHCFDGYVLERVAAAMRRGEYSYISLESMLSEYGIISQIPLDRLTVMTTGRKGTYQTPYGVIEFTHTSRSVPDIISNTRHVQGRPLHLATREAAWRDLKRVGRNTQMVNTSEMHDDS
jgi:predicted transcriptional regulator of viral defense system